MEGPSRHQLTATAHAGRLDRWLAEQLPLSRSRIKALIGDGQVTVDGKVCKARHGLVGGEQIVVELAPPPPSTLVRDAIPVSVLHLDPHIIVVDKAAGMVVHPAKGHPRGTLVNALLHHLDAVRAGDAGAAVRPDSARPGIVHRLDKGTSGVMVVARTPSAMERLSAMFAAHAVDRRYLALVKGDPGAPVGRIETRLGRHPHDRKRFAVVEDGGKRAVTHWSRLAVAHLPVPGARRGGVVSLIECRLETGRTHQVRVHLSSLGYPLLGDPVYRVKGVLPPVLRPLLATLDHQLLHAWHLGFDHPITGERLSFTTPPPPDYIDLLDICGLSLPAAPLRELGARGMVAPAQEEPTEAR